MLVQAGLCRTCSKTTLLVFPRGGSFVQHWSQETTGSLIESTSVNVPLNCEITEMDGKVDNETEQIPTDINGEIK